MQKSKLPVRLVLTCSTALPVLHDRKDMLLMTLNEGQNGGGRAKRSVWDDFESLALCSFNLFIFAEWVAHNKRIKWNDAEQRAGETL